MERRSSEPTPFLGLTASRLWHGLHIGFLQPVSLLNSILLEMVRFVRGARRSYHTRGTTTRLAPEFAAYADHFPVRHTHHLLTGRTPKCNTFTCTHDASHAYPVHTGRPSPLPTRVHTRKAPTAPQEQLLAAAACTLPDTLPPREAGFAHPATHRHENVGAHQHLTTPCAQGEVTVTEPAAEGRIQAPQALHNGAREVVTRASEAGLPHLATRCHENVGALQHLTTPCAQDHITVDTACIQDTACTQATAQDYTAQLQRPPTAEASEFNTATPERAACDAGLPRKHNALEAGATASGLGEDSILGNNRPLSAGQLREALASLRGYDWDTLRVPRSARLEAAAASAAAEVAPTTCGSDALSFTLEPRRPGSVHAKLALHGAILSAGRNNCAVAAPTAAAAALLGAPASSVEQAVRGFYTRAGAGDDGSRVRASAILAGIWDRHLEDARAGRICMVAWHELVSGTWKFPPEVADRLAVGDDAWFIVFRDPAGADTVGHVWALHAAWEAPSQTLHVTITDDSSLRSWTKMCADLMAAPDFLRALMPSPSGHGGLAHVRVGSSHAPTMDPAPRCNVRMTHINMPSKVMDPAAPMDFPITATLASVFRATSNCDLPDGAVFFTACGVRQSDSTLAELWPLGIGRSFGIGSALLEELALIHVQVPSTTPPPAISIDWQVGFIGAPEPHAYRTSHIPVSDLTRTLAVMWHIVSGLTHSDVYTLKVSERTHPASEGSPAAALTLMDTPTWHWPLSKLAGKLTNTHTCITVTLSIPAGSELPTSWGPSPPPQVTGAGADKWEPWSTASRRSKEQRLRHDYPDLHDDDVALFAGLRRPPELNDVLHATAQRRSRGRTRSPPRGRTRSPPRGRSRSRERDGRRSRSLSGRRDAHSSSRQRSRSRDRRSSTPTPAREDRGDNFDVDLAVSMSPPRREQPAAETHNQASWCRVYYGTGICEQAGDCPCVFRHHTSWKGHTTRQEGHAARKLEIGDTSGHEVSEGNQFWVRPRGAAATDMPALNVLHYKPILVRFCEI